MLKEGKRIRFLEAELTPYAFQSSQTTPSTPSPPSQLDINSISVIPNRLETFPPDQHQDLLANCFGGWLCRTPIICSSAPSSQKKVAQLTALAHTLYQQWEESQKGSIPFRLTCDQLQSVGSDWDMIHDEHQSIVQFSETAHLPQPHASTIHHLCSPIDLLVAESPPQLNISSVQRILDEMPKILNMEAWADYCFWYSALLADAFHQFPYDAVDEYSLEKYLQDFQHETASPFLKRARRHLLLAQLAMGTPESPLRTSHQDQVNKEKAVIKVRYELQKLIHDHYLPLREMIHELEAIETAHPELEKIIRIGVYLKELLGQEVDDPKAAPVSWGRGQMLKQLLCSELQVIPAIHCDTGMNRTHLAFAIRAAIMTMKEKLSWKELKELVLKWDETTVLLNRLVAKQGEKGLNDPAVKQTAQSVITFRSLVYGYLKHFCVPISEWNREKKSLQLKGNVYFYPEPLNFLPSYQHGHRFVEYDYASGTPIRLVDDGLRFYTSIHKS